MTRPRLGRGAMNALYARAMAENAELQGRDLERRLRELDALARLALTIQASGSPATHPRLEELMARKAALARAGRP